MPVSSVFETTRLSWCELTCQQRSVIRSVRQSRSYDKRTSESQVTIGPNNSLTRSHEIRIFFKRVLAIAFWIGIGANSHICLAVGQSHDSNLLHWLQIHQVDCIASTTNTSNRKSRRPSVRLLAPPISNRLRPLYPICADTRTPSATSKSSYPTSFSSTRSVTQSPTLSIITLSPFCASPCRLCLLRPHLFSVLRSFLSQRADKAGRELVVRWSEDTADLL